MIMILSAAILKKNSRVNVGDLRTYPRASKQSELYKYLI